MAKHAQILVDGEIPTKTKRMPTFTIQTASNGWFFFERGDDYEDRSHTIAATLPELLELLSRRVKAVQAELDSEA